MKVIFNVSGSCIVPHSGLQGDSNPTSYQLFLWPFLGTEQKLCSCEDLTEVGFKLEPVSTSHSNPFTVTQELGRLPWTICPLLSRLCRISTAQPLDLPGSEEPWALVIALDFLQEYGLCPFCSQTYLRRCIFLLVWKTLFKIRGNQKSPNY